MSATAEEYQSASDHVSAVAQLISSEESTVGIQDSEDASEHRVLELKNTGHVKNDEVDVAGRSTANESSADEGGRHSLDVTSLERPYEPIAKTLEADKDNATEAAVSSKSLAPAAGKVVDAKATSDETTKIIEAPLHTEVPVTLETQPEQATAHDTTVRANSAELLSDVPKHEESVIEPDIAHVQAPVADVPETHISIASSDAPTIAEETCVIDTIVETNEHKTETVLPTPEVEAHTADTVITETEASSTQPAEPATPEEGTDANAAMTAPAIIPVEVDGEASPAEPGSHTGTIEALTAAAIDMDDCPTKLLVAVDARTLAKSLLVDGTAPAIPETVEAPAIPAEVQPTGPTSTEAEVLCVEKDHALTEVGATSTGERESVVAEAEAPVTYAEVPAVEPTTVDPDALHAEEEHPSNETEIVAPEPEVPITTEEVQAVEPMTIEPDLLHAEEEHPSKETDTVAPGPEVPITTEEVQAVEPMIAEPEVHAEEQHPSKETEPVTPEREVPIIAEEVQAVHPVPPESVTQQEPTSHEAESVIAEPEATTVLAEAQPIESASSVEDQVSEETELIATTEAEVPTLNTEFQSPEATIEPETLHKDEEHISETVQMTSTSEIDPRVEVTGEEALTEADVPMSQGGMPFVATLPVVIVKDTPLEDEPPTSLEERSADTLSIQEDAIERPWTPSYSVTTQGPGELDLAEKLYESGRVSPLATDTPNIVFDNVDIQEPIAACAESESVNQVVDKATQEEGEAQPYQGELVAGEEVPVLNPMTNGHIQSSSPLAIDISLPSLGREEGTERPKSPWTPSYSVTTQGSATHDLPNYNKLDQPSTEAVDQLAHAEGAALVDSSVSLTDISVDQPDYNNHLTQPTTIPAIDITKNDALTDSKIFPDIDVVEENGGTVHTELSLPKDEIISKSPSQLAVDTPAPNLAGEEESRPKSPWTPSYSVTSQGSAMQDAAELEALEQLPPSVTEVVDWPEDAITAEKSVHAINEPLPDVVQDDHDSGEQSILVPAIDITHSDELAQANTKEMVEHDGTSLSQSCSFEDVRSEPPLQLVVDTSCSSPTGEQDRPKSPWTPSYSVTTQGSSPHELEELNQLEQLPPNVVEPFELQIVEGTDTAVHDIPSVCETQPDGLPQPEVTVEPTHQKDDDVQDELEAPASAQPKGMSSELKEPVSLVIADDIVEDRPKSPWTPSYSVITQGPGTEGRSGLRQEDLDQLEQLPERAIDAGGRNLPFIRTCIPAKRTEEFDNTSIASDVPEPPLSPQSDLGILTPSFDTRSEVSAASREPASPTSSCTDLASSGVSELVISPTINGSLPSFTADRDNTTPQYTPMAAFRDVPDVDSDAFLSEPTPVNEAFPGNLYEPQASLVPHSEFPKTLGKKLSLLHLPSVEAACASPISMEPSVTPTRKRLESTTSSRFFPGSWFSSSPIVPIEGNTRTSLDVASGEFVQKASTESPVDDATSSPKVEDDEKRARWCTIM